MTLFLCEKPDHVKHLSKFLDSPKREGRAVRGRYGGEEIVLFPLSGHVMGIPYPNEAIEKFKEVSYAESLEFLPVMPDDFKKDSWFYVKWPTNKKIYNEFKKAAKGADRVVLATDPDNEGAALGVEVLLSLGMTGKIVAYMDMSNLQAKKVLQEHFENALKGKGKLDWRIMAYLGFIRKDLDYGIGVNVTRMLQILLNSRKSFGTQQTRLLHEIAKRYLANRDFKKKKFYKVAVHTEAGKFYAVREGETGLEEKEEKEGKTKLTPFFESKEEAERIAEEIKRSGALEIVSVSAKKRTVKSPKWLDGSDMAVEAGKKLKTDPLKLMDERSGLLEEMYLKGIMTYPRGDSKGKMPLSQFALQAEIAKKFAPLLGADRCDFTLKKPHLWYEDGTLNVNHTPYTIAAPSVDYEKLTAQEKTVFEIALRILLSVFYPDAVERKMTAMAKAGGLLLRLKATGDEDLGWRELYGNKKRELPDVAEGDRLKILKVELEEAETSPPPLYTKTTLIGMMKRKNIGTQATYSQLVEAVLDKSKGFVKVEKGKLIPTEFTLEFLSIVPEWAIHILDEYEETIAEKFEKKEMPISEALKRKNEIIKKVFQAVKEAVEKNAEKLKTKDPAAEKKEPKGVGECPKCGKGELLDKGERYVCSLRKLKKEGNKWIDEGECDFALFKKQKIGSITFTLDEKTLKKLLDFEATEVRAYSTKKKKKYTQKVRLNDEKWRIDLVFD